MAKDKERAIQDSALNILNNHPKIAFAYSNTSGKLKGRGGHWMTLGFVGLPDITFMTKTGQYGCIEVKTPGKEPTAEQIAFMQRVFEFGGNAFWITAAHQVYDLL